MEGVAVRAEPAAPRDISRGVLALVDDDITAATLRTGLAVLGDTLEVTKGNIRSAIRTLRKEVPPHALIVDISGIDHPQAALDDLARVVE